MFIALVAKDAKKNKSVQSEPSVGQSGQLPPFMVQMEFTKDTWLKPTSEMEMQNSQRSLAISWIFMSLLRR